MFYIKKRILYILTTVIALTYSCTTTKSDYHCGLDPNNFPKHGQDSRIIEFKRTAIMDTITVIINGQLICLTNNYTLFAGNIELTNGINNYKTTTDSIGQFKFYHIAAGTYKLKAAYVGHRQLNADSLHFGTGDIAELKIGLGRLGQDDLK